MIKNEVKVIQATCDGCKKSLVCPSEPHNTNYGFLKSAFGYGSRLDDCGHPDEYHLCEGCWVKALESVGIRILE